LKLKAALKGDNCFSLYERLSREQWLSRSEVEKLQIDRLRKLLDHASVNSKYFRENYPDIKSISEEIQSLSDLEKLPVLTRDDLQENFNEMLCPPPGAEPYADSSGGSTGNPVNFFHDNYYKEYANAFELLFLSWHGILRGDRTAIFWGADRDFKELSFKEKLFLKTERLKMLNSFNIDESTMAAFLDEIEKFRPDYIYGYASSLDLAAKHVNRSGNYNFRPRAIRSSAEMLYDSQRLEIEKAFGAKVSNFYGSREVNNLAAECPAGEGLHVFASGRIVEIADECGKQLPPGENGYLLVTDLTNFSFPFIRYKIGDMGIRKSEMCSCGRGYPLLENITGRSSDIITVGGKYIHGEYFTHLFYGQPDVKQFQVIQETENLIIVRIVADDRDMNTAGIVDKIRQQVGEGVEIKIEFVNIIEPLKTGKYRFTVNRCAENSARGN